MSRKALPALAFADGGVLTVRKNGDGRQVVAGLYCRDGKKAALADYQKARKSKG
ncbi:hypothetical protein [Paracidovorax anthurii]|uniref:hypothetical protein n=1 Tax=Paracidovorax anthurii TaxID=78229 RepID=UPI001473A164|nr:hypothetical protein [Paracidovorax anthurii]